MKRFVIYQDTNFLWRWELRLPNGLAVAKSKEGFATEEIATEAVRSVRRAGAKALVVEAFALSSPTRPVTNSRKKYFVFLSGDHWDWELRRVGGVVIAMNAQGFRSYEEAHNALSLFQKSCDAFIFDTAGNIVEARSRASVSG